MDCNDDVTLYGVRHFKARNMFNSEVFPVRTGRIINNTISQISKMYDVDVCFIIHKEKQPNAVCNQFTSA